MGASFTPWIASGHSRYMYFELGARRPCAQTETSTQHINAPPPPMRPRFMRSGIQALRPPIVLNFNSPPKTRSLIEDFSLL